MHEGWCEVPGNLTARTFTLNGAATREYPDYTPANPPPGYVPEALAPEIVATGQVIAGTVTPAIDTAHTGASDPANGKTFGVIGAWDGHRVGKGRVVVDSTWHHFFNINLTGDRYLEDDSLPVAQQQKLHGFYVADSSGARVPNDRYTMIMWYYRNIIYWLIPAQRHQRIWWHTIYDMTKRPQLLEELGVYADFGPFTARHYFYFGQLAEAYLAQARGACAVYMLHPILYKPKIPWWEWIQETVDIWDPVAKLRGPRDKEGERLAGALGMGPRPEAAATLGLGAALRTAAIVRRELAQQPNSARLMELIEKTWPGVLDHAVDEFAKELDVGAATQRKLEKTVAAQKASAKARRS